MSETPLNGLDKRPTSRSAPTNAIYLAIFLLVALGWLLLVNLPTLTSNYTGLMFRVGTVPWSDARGWALGPDQILSGNDLSGVPARRPLYPLYLSTIAALSGHRYGLMIVGQILVAAFVFAVSALVMRSITDRIRVGLFLILLLVWRPETATTFMAESLGMTTLMLAFSLLWSGIERRHDGMLGTGMFVFGLSQAVRPWPLFCLVTIPFIALFNTESWSQRWRHFALYLALSLAGFAFHPLSSAVFNGPNQKASYYAENLYGQVAGGRGWMAAWHDPEIARLKANGAPPEILSLVIYRRCWEIFKDNPKGLFDATVLVYRRYVEWLPRAFNRGGRTPVFVTGLFLLLMFWEGRLLTHGFRRRRAIVAGSLIALLVACFYTYALTMAVAVGIFVVVRHRDRRLYQFVLLYWAGILLSLPFVALDGGVRVRIACDIVHFILAAVGIGWSVFGDRVDDDDTPGHSTYWPRWWFAVGPAIAFVLFIVTPALLRAAHRDTEPQPELTRLQMDAIRAEYRGSIGVDELDAAWHDFRFGDPAMASLTGRTACIDLDYVHRDTFAFEPNVGIYNPVRQNQLWPLQPLSFRRTILLHERRLTLFPNVQHERLERFDGQQVVVVGRLEVRRRRQLYETAFLLVAKDIWFLDTTGRWTRIAVADLAAS